MSLQTPVFYRRSLISALAGTKKKAFGIIETLGPSVITLTCVFDRIVFQDIHWMKIDVEGVGGACFGELQSGDASLGCK